MGLSEAYFWESTPRKIIAIIDQKNEIEKAKIKNMETGEEKEIVFFSSLLIYNKRLGG